MRNALRITRIITEIAAIAIISFFVMRNNATLAKFDEEHFELEQQLLLAEYERQELDEMITRIGIQIDSIRLSNEELISVLRENGN